MNRLAMVLALVSLIACSDDDSPTAAAPGDDLVGSWRALASTDPDVVFRSDGTLTATFIISGVSVSLDGTWVIVGDKLVTVVTFSGETISASESYTVRGDRLTLVDDEDGHVEVYERQP